jgi:hypothetical protein
MAPGVARAALAQVAGVGVLQHQFDQRSAQVAALSIHMSGVSIRMRRSMPSDSAICIAFMVSSRQSG